MEQYVSKCLFLNTKPTVSNIGSNLKYLLLLNQENWEKKMMMLCINMIV